ncbi:helix-turn-helix domain-containing protein [Saccharopolyspora gloriosae]|uniref:helix-turn-helix domain-containing protein n=1 Tax=Saccharopolyspora gloriosae TaxID=455344 RepID=UPI001FB63FC8|nr:helix-turn-helix domain-containing protein [Saccharopolyspora gloriosae]
MYPHSSLSREQREAAVVLFGAGHGAVSAAARLGVSASAVRTLRDRWLLRGPGALIMKPTKRSYSFEFKLDVVLRFVAGQATAAELAAEHDLSSPKQVKNWARQYRRDGEDALRPKREGRPPREPQPPPDGETAELERLRTENLRLSAENAYLKKLRALKEQGRG